MRLTTILSVALTAVCCITPAPAQRVVNFGSKLAPRQSTNVVFQVDGQGAGMSIQYGQPEWKDEYDTMLDKLKGRLSRLGKDWWTTLSTSVDVEIGGTMVAAGNYVLGLQCDKDGKFSIVGMEATKALKSGAVPFGPQTWKPDFVVPMEFKKDANKTVVQLMEIELTSDAKDAVRGALKVRWGKHELIAPMAVSFAKR